MPSCTGSRCCFFQFCIGFLLFFRLVGTIFTAMLFIMLTMFAPEAIFALAGIVSVFVTPRTIRFLFAVVFTPVRIPFLDLLEWIILVVANQELMHQLIQFEEFKT